MLLLLIAAGMFIYAWSSRKTAGPSRPEIKSLAVLPLENLSSDASQEYFADGMTEALISNLFSSVSCTGFISGSPMRTDANREGMWPNGYSAIFSDRSSKPCIPTPNGYILGIRSVPAYKSARQPARHCASTLAVHLLCHPDESIVSFVTQLPDGANSLPAG